MYSKPSLFLHLSLLFPLLLLPPTLSFIPRATSPSVQSHKSSLTSLFSISSRNSNSTTPSWPYDGRDSLPYVLKSTTPIQESSSSSSPDLGVYNLPPNLGKGDVLTFPAGMEGKEEDVKYKVKRVRYLYKYSIGTKSFKVTKKILEVTEEGRDKVERLLERNVANDNEI